MHIASLLCAAAETWECKVDKNELNEFKLK